LDETELKYNIEWSSGTRDISGWVANIKTHTFIDENETETTALLVFLTT
jgi:hypothetical protein